MQAPGPITAGPRTTEPLTLAPSLRTTRPSTREASSISPSSSVSISSSTSRLASSMSASWPVSFHQPVTISDCTRWPSSIRPWIASVISSSPRQEGSSARAASKIAGPKR